jgi:hypothetical protein
MHEDLVAGGIPFLPGRLEDQFAAVETPVGFGIVPAESQLPDIGKVLFLGIAQRISGNRNDLTLP